MNDKLNLVLNRAEALVFFDWLALLDNAAANLQIDAAQQRVIWSVEGQLEKLLAEVVRPDYQEQVAIAKRRVLGISGL